MSNEDLLMASNKAETSVDILASDKNDCKLSLQVSVEGKTLLSSDHDMTFDEAEAFVLSLGKQVQELKSQVD
jgi:hypothetical protein